MTTAVREDLVVQGPALAPPALEHLLALSRAAAILRPAPGTARLVGAHRDDAVAVFCERHRLDCAWVPQSRRLAGLRLAAMDMDSTLITIECLDEIGDFAGRKDEIAAITAQAMRGEIEYRDSLRRRVALLAGLEESVLGRVYDERLRLSPGAGAMIAALRAHGVHLLLVSGGFTFFTERLKARLGLDEAHANMLEIAGGRLTGRLLGDLVDAEAKAARLAAAQARLGIGPEATLAIGDGANDLAMMRGAGVSVAWRAKPKVRAAATHTLDHAGLDAVLGLYAC